MTVQLEKYLPIGAQHFTHTKPEDWPGNDPLKPGQVGFVLHRHKISNIPDDQKGPLFFVRTGFGFRQVSGYIKDAETKKQEKKTKAEADKAEQMEADESAVLEVLQGMNRPTHTALYEETMEKAEISQQRAKDAIARLLKAGRIADENNAKGKARKGFFIVEDA